MGKFLKTATLLFALIFSLPLSLQAAETMPQAEMHEMHENAGKITVFSDAKLEGLKVRVRTSLSVEIADEDEKGAEEELGKKKVELLRSLKKFGSVRVRYGNEKKEEGFVSTVGNFTVETDDFEGLMEMLSQTPDTTVEILNLEDAAKMAEAKAIRTAQSRAAVVSMAPFFKNTEDAENEGNEVSYTTDAKDENLSLVSCEIYDNLSDFQGKIRPDAEDVPLSLSVSVQCCFESIYPRPIKGPGLAKGPCSL